MADPKIPEVHALLFLMMVPEASKVASVVSVALLADAQQRDPRQDHLEVVLAFANRLLVVASCQTEVVEPPEEWSPALLPEHGQSQENPQSSKARSDLCLSMIAFSRS